MNNTPPPIMNNYSQFQNPNHTTRNNAPIESGTRVLVLNALILLLLMGCPSGIAEIVGWHPKLKGIYEGRGIDIGNQEDLKAEVAILDGAPIRTDNGGGSVTINYTQNQSDMASSFSLNSSISVKSLVFSGKVGFSVIDNQSSSQNSLTFTYVSLRDFGTKVYRPTGVSAALVAFVKAQPASVTGAALRKAVSDRYGTHYVSGRQEAARVAAVYTFTFKSQARAQSYAASFSSKYRSGGAKSEFQLDVQSLLNQKETDVEMTYQMDSTDPIAAWPIATAGSITNYQQFLDFSTKMEQYSQSLPPERAQPITYVIERNENIPGFIELLQGSDLAFETADYDRFLSVYGEYRNWERLLFDWTGDARRMSWLNTNGQQMVVSMRKDLTDGIRALEDMAKKHFSEGASLQVSENILDNRAAFGRIPLPTINIARRVPNTAGTSPGTAESYWFGYIDAGPLELTIESPFPNLCLLFGGTEVRPDGSTENPVPIYWNTNEFISYLNSPYNQTTPDFARTVIAPVVLREPLLGQLLTMAKTRRVGFFLVFGSSHYDGQYDDWMLGIGDATGDFVDLWKITAPRATPLIQNLEGSSTVGVAVGMRSAPPLAVVGAGSDYVVGVTNSGPGAAYGVTVTMEIDPGFELASIVGSQGYGVITNGQLSYFVGSLANGSQASIGLRMVPLKTGEGRVGSLMTSGVGHGLNNLSPYTTVAPRVILAQSPRLSLTGEAGSPKVSWTSESARLVLERTVDFQSNAAWAEVVNGIDSQGAAKEFALPIASPSGFYRLKVR